MNFAKSTYLSRYYSQRRQRASCDVSTLGRFVRRLLFFIVIFYCDSKTGIPIDSLCNILKKLVAAALRKFCLLVRADTPVHFMRLYRCSLDAIVMVVKDWQ